MKPKIRIPSNLTSVTSDGEKFSLGYVVGDGLVVYENPMPYEELEILHQQLLENLANNTSEQRE